MIKVLENLWIQETYLDIVKAVYNKPIANIMIYRETLKAFPLKLETRKGCPLPQLLFNTVLEALATAIREEKERKVVHTGREEVKGFLFANDMILN